MGAQSSHSLFDAEGRNTITMRRSRETEILRSEDNQVVGIWMKADFTSEHEWGVKDLCNLLGVDGEKLGIDGRTITSAEYLSLIRGKKGLYLYANHYVTDKDTAERLDKHQELHTYSKTDVPVDSAWSEKTFCVVAKDNETNLALEEIYQAAQTNDFALWIGGGGNNPFDRGGLVIAIKSRISQEATQHMLEHDQNERDLKEESERLGVEAKVKGCWTCGYKAFPYWTAQRKGFAERNGKGIEERTEHKVVYWLRGRDASGYFTVEEINEWVDNNTGVIADEIKQNTEKRVNDARAKLKA